MLLLDLVPVELLVRLVFVTIALEVGTIEIGVELEIVPIGAVDCGPLAYASWSHRCHSRT